MNRNKDKILISMVVFLVCTVQTIGAETVSVNGYSDYPDTMVYVPINVSSTSNLGAMDISLTYNPSVLSPTGIVDTGGLTTGALVMNDNTITKPYPSNWTDATFSNLDDNQTVWDYGALANYTGTSGVVNISIVCNATDIGFSGAGSVAVVKFAIIGTGSSPLNLSADAYNVSAPIINTTTGNVTGYGIIPITIQNGSVTGLMKGDFNGNSAIDIGDVAKIANLQLGNIPTTQDELNAGDFNNNGVIDIGDVAKLANYQLGNIDEL
jgi:hypothetical protein